MERTTRSRIAMLIALAVTASVAWAPAQGAADVRLNVTQVDASHFPQVMVYVSAVNPLGEPVAVSPADIVLQEDGTPVEPLEVRGLGTSDPLTTLLVMDVSGSMHRAGKLAGAKAAASSYINQMRPGDRAGVIAFASENRTVQTITSDHQALLAAIDGLGTQDDTAMYDALERAIGMLNTQSGRKAILVLTDGMDNRSQRTADQVIAAIGPSGLSISTLGLGEPSQGRASLAGLDEPALAQLAQRAGGSYAYANDPYSLQRLFERHGRALQSEYLLTYTSHSPLRDGVTRTLTAALGQGGEASTRYNPGGVVPEVGTQRAWGLFLGLLAGLLALLAIPGLIARGRQLVPRLAQHARPAPVAQPSRIRLHDEPKARIRLH
ncbi:MAG: VWA domain-containing protein [Chloroflexi bacterium]|nr:VWA domain-containing protein [Chloroflexota bacterium]